MRLSFICAPSQKKARLRGLFYQTRSLLVRAFERLAIRIEPLPRRARGMAILLPFQPRFAAVSGIVELEVILDLVECPSLVARAPFPAGAIARMVVREAVAALVVRLAGVVLRPVGFLRGRVDRLGHAFADQPTGPCTDRGPRDGSRRARNRTCSCARRHAARRCAKAGTDRVRAGRAGDRVAIGFAFSPLGPRPRLVRIRPASFWCKSHFRLL